MPWILKPYWRKRTFKEKWLKLHPITNTWCPWVRMIMDKKQVFVTPLTPTPKVGNVKLGD